MIDAEPAEERERDLGEVRYRVLRPGTDDLVLRLAHAEGEAVLAEPHARRMDFTGKPMKGWVYIAPSGTKRDADLDRWVGMGVAHALSLPARLGRGGRR